MKNVKKMLLALAVGISSIASALCGDLPEEEKDWIKGPDESWYVSLDKAAVQAKKSGKNLYVLVTGSDWCPWCMKLRNEIFSSDEFKSFADENFVLLYLDFPRDVKQPKMQRKHNVLAVKKLSFGTDSGVPNAKIFSPDGKELGQVNGFLPLKEYVSELKAYAPDAEKDEWFSDNDNKKRKEKK